jgi:hypothetical protein
MRGICEVLPLTTMVRQVRLYVDKQGADSYEYDEGEQYAKS